MARRGVSESTIAAFTRQLFAIRQTLKNEFPLAAKIETPDTDKDATIPVHPGAAAFVDGEEKTFLDRYSDFHLVGLDGAVGDGLGRRLVRRLSQEGRAQHQHLAARPAARHAGRRAPCNSMEELDRMQAEADAILRDTLQCFEHGAIEEGTLTAFNIAIEQFHNAVADRKALLMSSRPARERAIPRRISRRPSRKLHDVSLGLSRGVFFPPARALSARWRCRI